LARKICLINPNPRPVKVCLLACKAGGFPLPAIAPARLSRTERGSTAVARAHPSEICFAFHGAGRDLRDMNKKTDSVDVHC